MVGKIFNRVTGLKSLLLLILVSTTASRCGDEDPEYVLLTFVLPFSVTPVDPEINLGDTLWAEASFSENLEEYNSKEIIAVKNLDFQSKIGLFELVSNSFDISDQPSAVDFFDFVPKAGTIPFVGATFSPFTMQYQDNAYTFRVGLVPKKTGVFSVNFLPPRDLDLRQAVDLRVNSAGQKKLPTFEFLLFDINNGNTNFDLFKQHCKAISLENDVFINVYYEQKGTFTFRVIE